MLFKVIFIYRLLVRVVSIFSGKSVASERYTFGKNMFSLNGERSVMSSHSVTLICAVGSWETHA